MKKNGILFRTFSCLLIICVFLCAFAGCDESSELKALTPTDEFYVNDFANVIDSDDESEILSVGAALADKTTAQVVAVTVETTGDKEISDYALELGRDWGIGDKEKNNGVLILLASGDREVYIAVGYGLEGALPDSKTGRLIDRYAIEHFSEDDFSEGMLSVYRAVANEVYIEYGITPPDEYTPIDELPDEDENGSYALRLIVSWIILLVILSLFSGFIRRRRGFTFFGGPFGGGFGGGNFHGGFGGFGGSSGGGFHGSGGSFGGGGAGRKF